MKAFLWLACCLLVSTSGLVADEVHKAKSFSETAQQEDQPPSQALRFRTLLQEGSTLAAAQNYGRAALAFERALVITDAYPPAHRALASIRQYTGADRFQIQVHPLVKTLFFLYYSCTASDLAQIIVLLVACILITLGLTVYRGWTRLFVVRLFIAGLGLFLLASVVSLMYHHHELVSPERVVVLEDVDLFARRGPGEEPLLRLPQATAARIVQREREMLRIALPGGATGWVDVKAVGMINTE